MLSQEDPSFRFGLSENSVGETPPLSCEIAHLLLMEDAPQPFNCDLEMNDHDSGPAVVCIWRKAHECGYDITRMLLCVWRPHDYGPKDIVSKLNIIPMCTPSLVTSIKIRFVLYIVEWDLVGDR